VVVLLAGAWDVQDRRVGGETLEFGTAASDEFARDELRAAIDVLGARGAAVHLLTTPQFAPPDLGLAGDSPRFDASRIARLNELYAEVSANAGSTAVLTDLGGAVRSLVEEHGEITTDGVHFSDRGADLVAGWLGPQLTTRTQPRSAPGSAVATSELPAPRWRELAARLGADCATVVMNDYARYGAAFGIAAPDGGDERALLGYLRALTFAPDGGRSGLVPVPATGINHDDPRLGAGETPHGVSIAEVAQDARCDESGASVLRLESTNSWWSTEGTAPGGSAANLEGLIAAIEAESTYTLLASTSVERFSLEPIAARLAGPDAPAEELAAIQSSVAGEVRLRPYEALATGAGFDEGGPYTVLVLQHSSEADAQANVQRLESRIANSVSWIAGEPFAEIVEEATFRTEGTLLIAKLRSDSHALWYGLHAAGDTLLLHE
jgi:hypothetical protein